MKPYQYKTDELCSVTRKTNNTGCEPHPEKHIRICAIKPRSSRTAKKFDGRLKVVVCCQRWSLERVEFSKDQVCSGYVQIENYNDQAGWIILAEFPMIEGRVLGLEFVMPKRSPRRNGDAAYVVNAEFYDQAVARAVSFAVGFFN